MLSIIFNLVKRAIIIPAVVLAVAIAGLTFLMPRLSFVSERTEKEFDISSYNPVQYDEFSTLSEEAFVGFLSTEDFEFRQIPVLYNSDTGAGVSLYDISKEPWNGGGLILTGKNTYNQFRLLHNARVGDKISFDFYDNASFDYKISKIIPNVRGDELTSYYKDKTLVMCLPYNDFSNLGDLYYYTVYIAKQVK